MRVVLTKKQVEELAVWALANDIKPKEVVVLDMEPREWTAGATPDKVGPINAAVKYKGVLRADRELLP